MIDIHTHIFPPEIIAARADFAARDPWFAELYGNPQARMATADDLVAAMDANGVRQALTFGFGWSDSGIIALANEYVLAAVQRFPDRLMGLAVVQPRDGDGVAQVEPYLAAGFKGIGELMPHGQGYRLADTRLLAPLIDLVQTYAGIVLTHASEPIGHLYPGKGDVTLSDLITFLQAFPHQCTIAAHWGGGLPFYHLMPEVAAIAKNCWYDTAASPYLYQPHIFRTAMQTVGSERILWATDYPVIGYKRMARYLADSGLNATEIAQITEVNARELLGIRP